MPREHNFLAIDLGAESRRTMLGSLTGKQLSRTETHCFPDRPVPLPGGLHWDVLRLWVEIKAGIDATVRSGAKLNGLDLDTWGVAAATCARLRTSSKPARR